MINLFRYAEELAFESDSNYRGIRYDKTRLIDFMEANDWFEIMPVIRDKAPHIMPGECEAIRERLSLWLSAFKQADKVKLDVLLRHFESEYPQTCALYREFAAKSGREDSPVAWKLLDCICYHFTAEISECDEYEIEDFVRFLNADATLASARLFAEFMRFAKLSKWGYEFYSRERPEIRNDAYPLGDYAVMAYCVFNEEMWNRNRLIAKAAESAQFADLWLYTALHFLCALRSTDMTRLPAPKLPYAPDKILSDILAGLFPDNLAVALTDELTFRLAMKGLKPSKTSKHSDVPEIKLLIPESLRKPLGVIIAIVLAHRHSTKPGERFVFGADYRNQYKPFFGEDFAKAMGNRQLSVRRCNKSYLQGIEAATYDDEPGRPKGYILAALARSHKGGLGTLPEITDIYLKDANFTGYKPEFIAAQMFERGVFSFIASALLEIYSGKDFTRLPLVSQTALIVSTGLAPTQIESVMTALEITLHRAKETVSELICHRAADRKQVGNILQNIASGNAPSRMNECLCLMSAAGEHCPFPNRESCIDCGYEIYTKAAMQLLMQEYGRLRRERDATAESGRWRHTAILNDAILPAIAEIISCVKTLAPDSDISPLLEIAERGVDLNE